MLSDHEIALDLRSKVVLKIIPMMNPDGVYLGNTKGNLLGQVSWQDILIQQEMQIKKNAPNFRISIDNGTSQMHLLSRRSAWSNRWSRRLTPIRSSTSTSSWTCTATPRSWASSSTATPTTTSIASSVTSSFPRFFPKTARTLVMKIPFTTTIRRLASFFWESLGGEML